MEGSRVVITGMGVIAPSGMGKTKFWESLIEGRSGISEVSLFDVSELPSRIAGEIKDFPELSYLSLEQAQTLSRQTKFALVAAKEAIEDAGVEIDDADSTPKSVMVGISFPNIDILEAAIRKNLQQPELSKESALFLLKGNPFSTASELSLALGFRDASRVITTSCTGGINSIGYAYQEIREGKRQVVVAGGADGLMSPVPFICMCASGMLSKNNDNPSRACRPFDRYRDGGVMAEGAAFLVLESLDHARARSAKIYAEVVGFAETAVGVDPRFMKEGLKVVMQEALGESHLSAGDIDYISAHAPSDPMTDKMEVMAIKSVFGAHAYRIPISSIKAIIGSPFAAAGPMQVISTLLAMETGYLPPTCNYEHPDPDCDIDVVPNRPRRNIIEHALVNSHGLGGTDSALVLRRFSE